MKKFLILMILLLCQLTAVEAQQRFIRGIVKDSISDKGLPHASISFGGQSRGALTDADGIFELSVPENIRSLTVSCMGYKTKQIPLHNNSLNLYAIYLAEEPRQLDELVVSRKKYSKRNNPAVDFAKAIKNGSDATDPRRNDYYNYQKYQRITLGINDFNTDPQTSAAMRRMPFLVNHIDTSELTGKQVLNIAVRETTEDVHFRRHPKQERTIITGSRAEGIDEIADRESMQVFYNDVLREIDLYDNDINILQNRFVSPLSPLGPDFYRYYLIDTIPVDGVECVQLAFYPRNKTMFGFNGHIFVQTGDSTMSIKKVEMSLPSDINLNFVDKLQITQTYNKAPDGSRLKTRDDLLMEVSAIPGTQGLYIHRAVAYDNHNFNAPADSVWAGLGDSRTVVGANSRDSLYWAETRKIEATEAEQNVGLLMQRLRGIPLFYWGEKAVKLMFTGYVSTGNNSKFDYGPLNTTISYNTAEGVRLRAGGMTTANLSRRWFGRAYVAYGFRDHKWKYKGELEYSFIDKEYHSREFPVQSLRLTHSYDLDQIGQHYLYTNPDNVFLSLKRMADDRVTYRRTTRLEWICELRNNLSFNVALTQQRQEATRWLPFVDGYGESFGHYNESSLELQIRYAPGEKFYQTKSHRIPVNLDAPVLSLTQTMAFKGFLGSKFSINKTEISLGKRIWLSAFGYVDGIISGGHIWSRSPFLNLLIPNVNLSYTIQPESFALMNPMEFINDSYAQWDLTYWANGLLMNQLPLLKKLRLREVVAFRGIYGHLSQRNDPAYNPELFAFPVDADTRPMNHGPYMELSAGLDNIFRCLRVDYVWRLSYRNVDYRINRGGVRISLHVTF